MYIYIYVLYIHTITYNYIYMHHAHTHIPCWKNNTYISPFPNRSLGSWNCSHRSWCTVYITMRMSISEHNYLHMEWKWCVYKTMMMIYIYIYVSRKKSCLVDTATSTHLGVLCFRTTANTYSKQRILFVKYHPI